jgi:hypothetical protein
VADLFVIGPVHPDKTTRRLIFLARAAARFDLIQCGEMEINEAFEGLIVSLRCTCDRERLELCSRLDRLPEWRRSA